MTRRGLAPVLLLTALAAPAFAEGAPSRLVTSAGVVLEVGNAQVVVPGGSGEPAHPALSMTLSVPGAAPATQIVPGTESAATDRLISVSLAADGVRADLLWMSQESGNQRRFVSRMVDIEFGTWLEPRDLLTAELAAGAPEPTWILTRDQYSVTAEDGSDVRRHSREVAHLFWWAPGAIRPSLHYAPVILVDGKPIGSPRVFALDELDQASAFGAPPTSALFSSLAVQRNGDEPRLGLIFLSPQSGRLLGVELQVLPGELSILADRARGHIIDLGATLYPGQMNTLADRARGHIIDLSTLLHPAAAQFAADGVRGLVAGYDTLGGLNTLAERARGHIIDLVSTPVRGGVATEVPATSVATFELPEMATDGSVALSHLVRARALHSWAIPSEITVDAETRSLISARGDAAILAWQSGDGSLAFVESNGESFGTVRHLSLATMSFESAVATLQDRLGGR